METYACLLRGINVGGNNIIPMAALKETFEELGYTDVATLIASGNVVFCGKRASVRSIETRLEHQLAKRFDYAAKVVVKTCDELAAIVATAPRGWARPADATHRYYVMFLRHTIDHANLLETITPRATIEWLDYTPGALYWRAVKKDLGRSTVAKQLSASYADMTVRNWNTTRKLAAVVAATASRQSHLPRA